MRALRTRVDLTHHQSDIYIHTYIHTYIYVYVYIHIYICILISVSEYYFLYIRILIILVCGPLFVAPTVVVDRQPKPTYVV
jgi:hypothetical protein